MVEFYSELYDELVTFIKFLAWIDAVPDESKLSRRDFFEKDGLEIVFPEVRAYYLIEHLFDIGISIGDHSITYSEIEAWQRLSGVELQPFEARFLKKLSEAYLSAAREAADNDAESPWEDAPIYMSKAYLMARRMQKAIEDAVKD
jgi:hypothetical protein